MTRMLEGRKAVITGGARGNGEGIARVFLGQGASVSLWDMRAEVADTAARLAAAAEGEAFALEVDISDGAAVERAAAETLRRLGGVDILVNNAAIAPEVPFVEMSEELRERVWRVNVAGAMNCTKALLPTMIRQRSGRIIVVSSVTGPISGIPGLTMYASTKGALLGFVRNLALEVAEHQINVNAILPGTIDTPLFRESFGFAGVEGDRLAAEWGRSIPWGRVGTIEEIGGVAAFLASDWASYVTGTEIVVDGGNRLTEWVSHPALIP